MQIHADIIGIVNTYSTKYYKHVQDIMVMG